MQRYTNATNVSFHFEIASTSNGRTDVSRGATWVFISDGPLQTVNRRSCRHVLNIGKTSSMKGSTFQMEFRHIGWLQFSKVSNKEEIYIHPEIFHLTTGSYKLRGSEQLYSDSKNDKLYLFQVTCIVSHNVKFLQFLETSNFIMKKTPVLQKNFGRVGVREVQTGVECECLNKQKGSVRLVKSKFKIGALDIDPICYQSVTRRLVNFCIAKLYTGRHSREKLIR